jgi:hypothetical protein
VACHLRVAQQCATLQRLAPHVLAPGPMPMRAVQRSA